MTDRALNETLEIVRIPLGAADEGRVQSGRVVLGSSNFGSFDQAYVNCFPVNYKDPLRNDTTVTKLVSRYGINYTDGNVPDTAFTNPDTTSPVAMQALTMLPDCVVIAFWDATDEEVLVYEYRFSTGVYDLVTTITGFTGSPNVWITEINISNVCNIAIVVDNGTVSEAWNVADVGTGTLVGGVVAQYTGGGNFPTEAPALRLIGPMLQMNTYVFALASDGYIYNCELSGAAPDISAWNVLGKVEVSSQPDGPVRMIRYKHHILVLGSSSIEFFNFDSTITPPASPLASTNQAYINFGCVGTNAAIVVDDTLFWVAASKDGALGLWRLDGYTPVQLTGNYNSVFLQLQAGDINMQVVQMHGQRHLITNSGSVCSYDYLAQVDDEFSPTNTLLYGVACYCIDTGVWWQWVFEDYAVVGHEILVARCIYNNRQIYLPVSNYGHVPVTLPTSNERDNSLVGYDAFNVKSTAVVQYYRIPYLFITNAYDFETSHRKTIHRIKLVGDIFHTYPPKALQITSPFANEAVEIFLIATRMDQASYNPGHFDIRQITVKDTVNDDTSDALEDYTKQYEIRANRFGHGRRWKFGFCGNFFSPFRFDAFEVTVQKGAH